MADITGLHTGTTNAVEVPEVWSDLVLDFQQANLVMANLVERRDLDVVSYGDTINMPVTAETTTVDYTEGDRLTDNLQANTDTQKVITITDAKMRPFLIPWTLDAQSKYDIKADRLRAATYAISKAIDTTVAAEGASLTTTDINTAANAVILDDILEAYETLNSNNVPVTERAWVFRPSAYRDLLNLAGNHFISSDFTSGRPLENGKIGEILGSPVYQSTNIAVDGTGGRNLYFHKQAFGLAMQKSPKVESEYYMEAQGDMCNVRTLYGVTTLRPDFGVVIYN